MKREMDLLRSLLLNIEEHCDIGRSLSSRQIKIDGHTEKEIVYHALLARDAGLIEAKFALSGDVCVVQRLTFEGHEFLDAAREDTLWRKAKETVLSNASTVTLEALRTALAMLMQKAAHGGI